MPDTGASTVCRLGESAGALGLLMAQRSDAAPPAVEPLAGTRSRRRGAACGLAASRARDRAGSYNPAPMPPPHRPVNPRASFPELEERVLERWRERDVFAESLRRRAGAPAWGFYEGPPTANGPPGTTTSSARVFKDIFPRYKTMCGFYVERKGGWDCHGLPVELALEAELGLPARRTSSASGSPSSTPAAARRCSAMSRTGTG